MSLIQLLKYREVEMVHYKISHFETPHSQMEVFEMEVTIASGLGLSSLAQADLDSSVRVLQSQPARNFSDEREMV